ncbi:MAG: hypothetical protein ACK5RT_00450 [Dolichospermum sp.]|jgi:hypothetical protein
MSTQNITTDLLVKLSAEEQQILSGGCRKSPPPSCCCKPKKCSENYPQYEEYENGD